MLRAQPTPVGPEFQVNTFTTGVQYAGGAAMDGAGDFVLVWGSFGGHAGAFVQRFDASGAPVGSEFRANTNTLSTATNPVVASDAAGNFLVAWEIFTQDGDAHGVFGQLYDGAGAPVGGEFQINTYTTLSQSAPAVAADGAGNFVVVWQSFPQDGDSTGVFGRLYDGAGTPLGGEFAINSYTTSFQFGPSVAADAVGNFVVVWTSYDQDGYRDGVFARRFDATGTPVGPEFQVNEYTTGNQNQPSVAARAAGDFMVVWQSFQDGASTSIHGRRYDAAGLPQGPEFQVNTYTSSSQLYPVVAAEAAGDFLVVWQSFGPDGDQAGVLGQRYDGSGVPEGVEFQVNTYTTGNQRNPVLAVGGDAAVVAWSSFGQTSVTTSTTNTTPPPGGGTSTTSTTPPPTADVYGQLFSFAPPLSTSSSSTARTSTTTSTSSTTSTTALLQLTKIRIRGTSPPGGANGVILIRGEFPAPAALAAPPPPIIVNILDGATLNEVHSFDACAPIASGLRCVESSPTGVRKAVFKLRPGAPPVYRARIRWSRLDGVDPPFTAPVTIYIAQVGTPTRVGSIATCEATAVGLRCAP
jgi:hypothetical protein